MISSFLRRTFSPTKRIAIFNGFIFLCGICIGTAQAQNGAITGTVQDSNGSVLISAKIDIQPTGREVVSDNQGQFRIANLTPGDYTLTASYVGFSPYTTTVKVLAGQAATVTAALDVGSQADQVLVTAERLEGQAEAINVERMSEDIVQVLPESVILSLPNKNIADAVGRLPSVTLERDEGEGKYVQIRVLSRASATCSSMA
jgi:hypothetical protein